MGSGNTKKFEWKLGRTGLVIVIAGMTVLLCLSFMLGLGVGRNMETYPEKISSGPQRFLAYFWRPTGGADQEKQAESRDAGGNKIVGDQVSQGAQTVQKPPASQQPPAEEKKTNPDVVAQIIENKQSVPAAAEQKGKTPVSGEPVTRAAVASGEAPSAEKKSGVQNTLAASPSAGSSFVIHVASLKDKSKAGQIHKAVAAMGYSSKIVKVELKGKGTWYRVVATGFETKAEAQTASERISKKVKTNCIIRPIGQDAGKNQ